VSALASNYAFGSSFETAFVKYVALHWKIFSGFLKNKAVNYSVFALFANPCFEDYFKVSLRLKFLILPHIFEYPKLTLLFIENV